jgi:hypothetical protein
MKYARTDGNTVVEIIEPFFAKGAEVPLTERFPPDVAATLRACADEVAPGWVVDGDSFAAPAPAEPPPPPSIVSMRQARLALLGAGLLDKVTAAIGALPSPQKEAAQIEWEFAATVDRASPMVAMLSQSLGLDRAQLSELFATAATL